MRDRKPTLVDRLAADLGTVRWPEAAEIRARARRRTRRQVTGVAVALLLVVGASAVVFGPATQPDPHSVDASVASRPPHAEIPVEALLQPDDLPERSGLPLIEAGLGEPVRVAALLAACRRDQGLPDGWETSLWSRSQTLLRDRPAASTRPAASDRPSGDLLLLSQDVYRLEPRVAVRVVAGLDRLVAPCAQWRSVGLVERQGKLVTVEMVHRWTVTARDFAGDEAALLRHSVSTVPDDTTGEPLGTGTPSSTNVAVVRVGDLVTVISRARDTSYEDTGQDSPHPYADTGRDSSYEELRRLGQLAALRMCVAANPTC